MRRVNVSLALGILLVAGCERHAPERTEQQVDAQNPLEIAARERGVVRPDAATPVGVFERSHDLGRDAMCAVPDGAGQWRFAITAAFGTTLSCAVNGTMVREGGGWRMRFAGAEGCDALVREEEDELRLPGRLPAKCSKLCPARVSLAGLRLPRASWSADDARGLQIRDQQGNMRQPCGVRSVSE